MPTLTTTQPTTTPADVTPYDADHGHAACPECTEPFVCVDADCADEAWRAQKRCNFCFQQYLKD